MDEIVKVIQVNTDSATKSLDNLKNSADGAGKSFGSLKEAKQYIDSLTASLITLDEGSEEYNRTAKEIQDTQNKVNAAISTAKGVNDAAEGSYNALSKQMAELKKQWKATSDEAERDEIGKKILSINDQLKTLDGTVGVHTRNVGNYGASFSAALSSQVPAIKGVDAGFKALSANPIVAVIGALVLSFKAIVEQIQKSEDQTNRLKQAFSALEPISNALQNVLSTLSDALVTGITKGIELFQDLIGWVGKAAKALGWKSLADSIDEFNKKSEQTQEISRKSIELEKKKRDIQKQNADDEAKIADLRAKAADEENYTNEQRLKYYNHAIVLTNQLKERNVSYYKEEAALLKEKHSLTETSTAELNEEAAADAKVAQEAAKYDQTLKALLRTRNTLNKAVEKSNAEIAAEAEKLKKSREELAGLDLSVPEIKMPDAETVSIPVKVTVEENEWDTFRKNFADNLIKSGQSLEEYTKKFYSDIVNESGNAFSSIVLGDIDGTIESFDAITSKLHEITDGTGNWIKLSELSFEDYSKLATQAGESIANVLAAVATAKQKSIQQDLQNGKITEKEAEKEFERTKNMQIASAIIQGLAGAAAAIPQAVIGLGVPAGPIVGAALAASIAATTAVQVAQIKKQKFNSGSSSSVSGGSTTSVTSAVSTSTAQPVYRVTTPGTGRNTDNNNSSTNLRVYVVESDIREVGNRVDVVEKNSTF